ncbi:MAG: LPS export ABC transporter periplasmic protein LptC [Chitinophagia bacterium]|jgi:LPS export ABC transporter protein LptC|nr:LPS export ABC transporter periplasmic protein LptC [Chitinophagia bacterium]
MKFTWLTFSCSCLLALALQGCENDINEVREMARQSANLEVGTQINSYLSVSGKTNAHLTAPKIIRYQGTGIRKSEFPNTLHVDFFNDSMKIDSQIDAQYGSYMENDKKVLLKNHVVATNTLGDTLFTDELWWDQIAEKFYTDKKVIISKNFRRDYFVGNKGMTCDQNLTNLHLFEIESNSYTTYRDSSGQTPPPPPSPPAPVIKPVRK